jgi:hypothetical protein
LSEGIDTPLAQLIDATASHYLNSSELVVDDGLARRVGGFDGLERRPAADLRHHARGDLPTVLVPLEGALNPGPGDDTERGVTMYESDDIVDSLHEHDA